MMSIKKLRGIRTNAKLLKILEEIADHARISDTSAASANNNRQLLIELETAIKESSAGDDGTIPIRAITIAKTLATTKDLISSLDSALQNTQLAFSTPEETPQASSAAYQKRIQMLKLAEQERNYTHLTKNLNNSPGDDATLKSMMYAATVGANMIVAPISIGVLMYFFAGKIFSFMIPDYQAVEGKIDIHGVIAGVVAGVIMMFIEMILFVIRNHEMDKFVSMKMKRQKNPFGYDKKSAERTFVG
mmetsp:Transcript_372/g.622  ORF Transcript_372/g.622 Transcript_372/m.622 type:complete len:246 (+) Transcript_372:55-792(+)